MSLVIKQMGFVISRREVRNHLDNISINDDDNSKNDNNNGKSNK